MYRLITKIGIVMVCAGLTGCYGNWPQIKSVATLLHCNMTKSDIEKIALKSGAMTQWDDVSQSLTLAKEEDAITVVFTQKTNKISVIALTQSSIHAGGLMRRQGDVIVVERCSK